MNMGKTWSLGIDGKVVGSNIPQMAKGAKIVVYNYAGAKGPFEIALAGNNGTFDKYYQLGTTENSKVLS